MCFSSMCGEVNVNYIYYVPTVNKFFGKFLQSSQKLLR